MKNDNFKNRAAEIRRKLRKIGCQAAIITQPAAIFYLSGFSSDDSWLIIGLGNNWLLTDSRYTIQAQKQCSGCKIVRRTGAMAVAVRYVLTEKKNISCVLLEDRTEFRFFNAVKKELRKDKITVKPAGSLTESLRQFKDRGEVAAIKKAAEIAQQSLALAIKKIKVGITELEFASAIDSQMKSFSAVPAFETIVAFGSNSAMPHHRPSNRKLRKIDTVLIDFGANLNGYCSDITRCFAVGKVDSHYERVYKTVFAAQQNAVSVISAGGDAKQIDSVARDTITSAKLPAYGHGLGHGLGIEVHELPSVSFNSKGKLQAEQIITVEPGVYLPDKFGIRIEDDVLVTDRGCKILTLPLKNDTVPLLLACSR